MVSPKDSVVLKLDLPPQVVIADAHIQITIPGAYYIYSQVHFVKYFKECVVYDEFEQFVNYMVCYHRHSPYQNNELLLKSRMNILPGNTNGFFEGVLYVSGVVDLREGDQLSVEVSEQSYVVPDKPSTFFGLFKV